MTLPTDFANLAFWLDAAHTSNVGSNVDIWPDQTANGNDFQQTDSTHQPLWNASDANLNGLPSVGPFLAGSNSGLQYVGSNRYAAPWTIFIVSWGSSNVSSDWYTWGGALYRDLTGAQHFLCSAGGANDIAAGANSGVGAHALIGLQDANGGTDRLFVDSTTAAASAPTTGGTPPSLLSGTRYIGTTQAFPFGGIFNYPGTIGEIFAYAGRLLLASELSALGGYIQVKYGIPFSGATIQRAISGASAGEASASALGASAYAVSGRSVGEASTQAKIGVSVGGPIKLELNDDELLEFLLFDEPSP